MRSAFAWTSARRLASAAAIIVATTAPAAAQFAAETPDQALAPPTPAPPEPQSALAAVQDGALQLDTISIIANKTSGPVIDVMGGASVVTRSEIERLMPRSVSDVLRDVPGVTTQVTPNDPQQSINIRGLQDFGRVNVMVDGARQNYQISGHNANGSFYLDPEFIGQVDVVRGPIANIYGSGAIGGVVSFTTRGINDLLAADEKAGIEQTLGLGTNGAGLVSSTSGGARVEDWADVYGQFVYRDAHDYQDGAGDTVADSGNDLLGGLFKVNAYPGVGQTLSLTGLVQSFDFANNGTSGAGTRFRNDVEAQTYTLGYRFESPDNPLIDLSVKGYFSNTKNVQTVIEPSVTYAALGVVPGDKLSDNIDTWGFDVYNTSRFSTSTFDHAVTYGVDAVFDQVTTIDNAGGYVAAFTPGGDRTLAGAFIQDEISYNGWLRVLGGLRFDGYTLDGDGTSSDGTHLSPKITVGVTPVTGIEFYGTYAEGYRAPSISETLVSGVHPFPAFVILPNPNLRPEVGHNIEGGVNVKYDDIFRQGDSVRAKATAFYNIVDDYIDMTEVGDPYLVPFVPGMPASMCAIMPFLCFPITSQQYVNINEARLSGVELEGAYDWGGGFVSLSGTYIDGKNEDTGGPLNTVPPSRISSTLGLRFLEDRLTIGGRLTFVDASDPDVTLPSQGYGLVDVFASYRYNDQVRATFAIDNLFDRQYTPFLYSEAAPGLTAKFALTVKLAAK